MRIVMVVLVSVTIMGCGGEQEAATPDAGTSIDPLAARMQLCGRLPEEPILDPATMTDSQGRQYIVLSVDHWNVDAAYMNAAKAWSDCIEYGAH